MSDHDKYTVERPNGKICSIKEQIIEDLVTELTFQFEATEYEVDGKIVRETKMRIFGKNLPLTDNRELFFDENGHHVGSGAYVGCKNKPTWPMEIEE